jgi:hypothetical protein
MLEGESPFPLFCGRGKYYTTWENGKEIGNCDLKRFDVAVYMLGTDLTWSWMNNKIK